MYLISGIVLLLVSGGAFVFSLPKNGKTAKFVGSEWEGYVVVGITLAFVMSVVLIGEQLASFVKS